MIRRRNTALWGKEGIQTIVDKSIGPDFQGNSFDYECSCEFCAAEKTKNDENINDEDIKRLQFFYNHLQGVLQEVYKVRRGVFIPPIEDLEGYLKIMEKSYLELKPDVDLCAITEPLANNKIAMCLSIESLISVIKRNFDAFPKKSISRVELKRINDIKMNNNTKLDNEYNRGIYDGMEAILAYLEEREPMFSDSYKGLYEL